MDYGEFLNAKSHFRRDCGFEPVWMPDFLYDFQKVLTEWSIRQGRAAMFADCGLGKTPMQLVWAENVVRKTGGSVLVITPLSVAPQTVREGAKFGIEVKHSRDGSILKGGITATNYEQLHRFNPDDYYGIVCDESSAIKQFQGKRKREVIDFMKKTPYRLMCTATVAPNDYIEIGTHSEALGILGQMDMLSTFFKSLDGAAHVWCKSGDFWNTHKWVFKAHAEREFWRWVCSWARAIRKPSDIGFEDKGFELPPLTIEQTTLKVTKPRPGELFPRIARSLKEQREERHMTISDRCEEVAHLVNHDRPAAVWCQQNEEGDYLEKIIPGAVQVSGSDTDEHKEKSFLDFTSGNIRVLITKPKIGAFGLNWQHCSHMTFFPSHSFEQFYQGVRRCWRYGQMNPVKVDVVSTEGEEGVTANLKNKSDQVDRMFGKLVEEMGNAITVKNQENFTEGVNIPIWAA